MTSNAHDSAPDPARRPTGVGGSLPPGQPEPGRPPFGGGSIPPSATAPRSPREAAEEQSTPELLRGLAADASLLMHQELLLARQEITEGLTKAAIGSGLFAGAGLFGLYGLLFVLITGALALALVLPLWASFGIVALALLLLAGLLAVVGRAQLLRTKVAPERAAAELRQTTTDLKEEIKWARLLPTRRAKSS